MIEELGTKDEILEFLYDSDTLTLDRVYNNQAVRVSNEIEQLIPRYEKMFSKGIHKITENIHIVSIHGSMGVLVNNYLYKITVKSGTTASNYIARPYIEGNQLKCIHSFLLYTLYFVKVCRITPESLRRMLVLSQLDLEKLLTDGNLPEKPKISIKLRG